MYGNKFSEDDLIFMEVMNDFYNLKMQVDLINGVYFIRRFSDNYYFASYSSLDLLEEFLDLAFKGWLCE